MTLTTPDLCDRFGDLVRVVRDEIGNAFKVTDGFDELRDRTHVVILDSIQFVDQDDDGCLHLAQLFFEGTPFFLRRAGR